MSQDNKNLMLPTQAATWRRAMNELYDLSYDVFNASAFLCRRSPGTTLKHLTLDVLLCTATQCFDMIYETLHCTAAGLDILLPFQLRLASNAVSFPATGLYSVTKYSTLVKFVQHSRPLAAVIQPNRMSTEETLL